MPVGKEFPDRKHSASIPMHLVSEYFVNGELERVIKLGLFVDTYHQISEQKLLDSCWMACGELIETFILLDIISCTSS